jgi:hypothetical protein
MIFSFTIVFFGSLASQGSKKILLQSVLLVACTISSMFTTMATWEVLAVNTGNGYHLLQVIGGGAPSGMLPAGPAAVTIVAKQDVDGEPPRVCCGLVRWHPPP